MRGDAGLPERDLGIVAEIRSDLAHIDPLVSSSRQH